MKGLGLVASVFIALLIVLVKCEEDEICWSSEDCKNGCCYLNTCTTDESLCEMVKECYQDFECPTGCCINQQCKPKSSFQCIKKNGCTTNSECDSNCCKNNKCQQTDLLCFTFPLPTLRVNNDKCSSSTDCYKSNKGSCCVSGTCGTCRDEDYGGSSSYSSSSSSGRSNSTGIAIGVFILIIVKVSIWVLWCSRRSRRSRRSRGRVIVRRRVRTCVAVPIVQNDELQRAHERAEEGTPDYPPPAYSPIPEPHADSGGETLNQGEGIVNKSYNGVQQEPPMLLPPAYQPRQDASENTNSVQTEQAQREAEAGTTEDVNGAPQGPAILVPLLPHSAATNQHTAQTGPTIPNP